MPNRAPTPARSAGHRGRRLVAALAVAALTLAGAAAAQRPVIVSASFNDIRSLDPTTGSSTPDRQLISNIFSGLVRYADGSTEVEPDLATRWEISDDGRTYTFHLRDDVVWHGGYGAFTAHDVKFTLDRLRDPATGSRWRSTVEVIESIDVVDDHTVRMTLVAPTAPFLTVVLASMAGYVMNRQAIEDAGDAVAFNPIGTGPFRFVSYEPRQRVVLEAFPDFYRGAPEVQQVVWNVVPDESVQALALQRGDLNYMIVRDVEVVAALRASPGVVLTETPALAYYGYILNTRRAPFDDVRVRQAIAHALDKELYVDTLLGGQGRVTHTVIPAGMFGHTDDVPVHAYDPARARALLAEAGYPNGFTMNAVYTAADTFIAPMAAVLQQWLGDVGIRVELVGLDTGATNARRDAGDYDILVGGPARADPDEILTERFHSESMAPNGRNNSFYAAVDDLIEAQRAAVDPTERARILAEIQRRIAADATELPLFVPIYVTAHADYISGDVANTSNWIVHLDKLTFGDLSRCLPCR